MSDPGKYRTREERYEYRQKDPILILKQAMIEASLLTEEAYETMDASCRKISDASVNFAESSPEPILDDLYTDVLA